MMGYLFVMGRFLLLLIVLLVVTGGCGYGSPPATPPVPSPSPSPPSAEQPLPPQPGQGENGTSSAAAASVQIVAAQITFDKSIVTVPAGAFVTLIFTNDENPVIFHNIAIYKNRTATEPIMVGEFIPGGEKIIYQFVAPSIPGNYFFRCDVHPLTMIGEFIVE